MHVVVTDDESYNKKIKQRKKNRNFFFCMVEFLIVKMTSLRMYHFETDLKEMRQ